MSTASMFRTRWAATGTAVALSVGAGGIGFVSATVTSGERTVFVPISVVVPTNDPVTLTTNLDVFHDPTAVITLGNTFVDTVSATDVVGILTCKTGFSSLALGTTEVHFTRP